MTSMPDALLFCEDDAQERFIVTLVRRIADEHGVAITVQPRSGAGGFGGVIRELNRFATTCAKGRTRVPDLVVVAVDANCKGLGERRVEIADAAGEHLAPHLITAIADPHIERWYLLDGEGFKNVLGRGCDAPDQKCEKDRYKQSLAKAVRDAGVEPLLGGIEYAEDLAGEMNLPRASRTDGAFGDFVAELRRRLKSDRQS